MEIERPRSEFEQVDVSAAEAQLADRLDRLSVPLAENVLQRAIDLHQDQVFDIDNSIGWDQLEQVGAELGIDQATLRKALLAELETEQDPPKRLGTFQRLVGVEMISGGIVAEADRERVLGQLDKWMRKVEAMTPVKRDGATIVWEPAGSKAAALRRFGALFAGAESGDLREMGQVTTRVTEVKDGDQLIEISVDTEQVLDQVRGTAIGITILSALLGLGIGIAISGAAAALLGLIVGTVLGAAAGAYGAWQTAKFWTKKIRSGINKALDGIVHATTFKRRKNKSKKKHSKKPKWMEIVEEIFDEVFD